MSEEVDAFFRTAISIQKGVSVAKRSFGEYPNGDLAVHVIGYVGRVNQRDKERIRKMVWSKITLAPRTSASSEIEQSYESLLHGKNGYERLEVMASGRQVGVLGERSGSGQ